MNENRPREKTIDTHNERLETDPKKWESVWKTQPINNIILLLLTSVPWTFNFIWSSRVVLPSFRFFQQYPSRRYRTFFREYSSIEPLFGLWNEKETNKLICHSEIIINVNNSNCQLISWNRSSWLPYEISQFKVMYWTFNPY